MRERIIHLTKKDFRVQTFRAGGRGGQNQNKRDTGVRIIHDASGAIGECREERSQEQNKRKAFLRLTSSPKFRVWLARVHWEKSQGKTEEQLVKEAMDPKNLLIEVKDEEGKWKVEN